MDLLDPVLDLQTRWPNDLAVRIGLLGSEPFLAFRHEATVTLHRRCPLGRWCGMVSKCRTRSVGWMSDCHLRRHLGLAVMAAMGGRNGTGVDSFQCGAGLQQVPS